MTFEPLVSGPCTIHAFPNKHKMRHSPAKLQIPIAASRKLEKPGGCQNPFLSLDAP